MKKPLWIGSVLGLIIVITLFSLFGKSLIGGPKLEIPHDRWDFGTAKTGSVLKHDFILKNTGKTELTINAYPNCPRCMSLELEKSNIPPNGTTKLHVAISSKGEGPYEVYVMLESNDPLHKVKKLTMKGTFVKD
ncbi:MAG TPA: DUF1573 domain-containing protein [Bacillota bacterium]|nr:DUF1573 domain-containing protein [Bacillota bacterium]